MPHSATHYARLAAVPIEYLSRLDAAVRQSTTWNSNPEHKAIRDKILELCDACKYHIWEECSLFRQLYKGDNLTEGQEIALRTLLRTTSGTFITLHELLLFLPGESTKRELNDFCSSLFLKEYDNKNISLILTSLFNAFEYSLDDVMGFLETDVFKFKIPDPKALPFGNVMELAIVDRNNPLNWAVLAHEFGHFLDSQACITETAIQKFTQSKFLDHQVPQDLVSAFERLGKEMVADITGYYLLGPSSILPLVNMSLLVGCVREHPIKFDGEHGAPTSRIRMVQSMCAEDQIELSQIVPLLDTLIEEEHSKELTLPPDEQKERQNIHDFLTALFQEVRPVVVAELQQRSFQQFGAIHHATAQDLSKKLSAGYPIGACRSRAAETEAAAQLLSLSPTTDILKFREQYSLLTEHAVNVSEVITAGWMTRTDKINGLLSRAFSMPNAQQAFDSFISDLTNEDALLLKSIDTIAMLESYHADAG